ncbi:MAG: ribosomal L7Ae/L30e/S12e/Gadd45 family protein, partial [Parasporobacterium sp.]|nr:ribosomal L7Ae/L30e/S12e/Gadd45 family protein [Parasporobacterium sp.]
MKQILGMIGLAAKAGKIVSGEFSTEKAIKENKAFLVIVAEDASANTKKHFTDMCSYRTIPIRVFSEKELLGKCTGKAFRASVAVTDAGFAETIKN